MLRIITARSWLFINFLFFSSSLSWSELSSISSLNLVNQLVLHGVSWLIWSRSRLIYFFRIYQLRKAIISFFFLDSFWLILSSLNFLMIFTRSDISSLRLFFRKPLAYNSKCALCFGSLVHFTGLCFNIVRAWTRGCVFNIFILVWVIRIISHMCRLWSFLWQHSTLSWILTYSWLSSIFVHIIVEQTFILI